MVYNRKLDLFIKRIDRWLITEKNKKLLKKYAFDLKTDGLTDARIIKHLGHLKVFAEYVNKDLDKVEKEDIQSFLTYIDNLKKENGENVSEWTKRDYRIALKKFYRWLTGEQNPEIIAWIKVKNIKTNNLIPEDLLTKEDVEKMINAALNTRDKAMIALLWDAGLRIGELGNMKIKDVHFDNYGAFIIVNGKTGKRRIRIVESLPYLMNWLEEHPRKDNPEAYLWVSYYKGNVKPMRYEAMRKQIKKAAEKAGIKKRIHPHIFRHSRATFLANHLTEAQMCEYLGWVKGSKMPQIYVHLSGRDVDKAILKLHGIEIEEEEDKPKPKKCPRCRLANPSTARFCIRCGAILDMETALELEVKENEMTKIFLENPELMDKAIKLAQMLELIEKIGWDKVKQLAEQIGGK